MRSDIFEDARRLVSTCAAAEYYGFHPTRAGYIACPFHNERTASLKLYDDGGWYCFGCHAGGSSIDFVSKLFEVTPLEAVRRMNEDFNLALPLDKPPCEAQRSAARRRRELQDIWTQFEEWREGEISRLNSVFRMAHLALVHMETPDKLTPAQAEAIQWQAWAEYTADILIGGTMAKQMEIFRDRKGVEARCNRILNNTPMKSGAA